MLSTLSPTPELIDQLAEETKTEPGKFGATTRIDPKRKRYGAYILAGVYKGSTLPIVHFTKSQKGNNWEIEPGIICATEINHTYSRKDFKMHQFELVPAYDDSMFKLNHHKPKSDPNATFIDKLGFEIAVGDAVVYVNKNAAALNCLQFGTVVEIKKTGGIYIKDSLKSRYQAQRIPQNNIVKLTEEQKLHLMTKKLADFE